MAGEPADRFVSIDSGLDSVVVMTGFEELYCDFSYRSVYIAIVLKIKRRITNPLSIS